MEEQRRQLRSNLAGGVTLFIPLEYLRSSLPFSSLCTTSTHSVWLNRPLRSRRFPTVSMLSATGRPRGFAGCGGFPWGLRRGRGRPFMSSRCKKIYKLSEKPLISMALGFPDGATMHLRGFDRLCYFRSKFDRFAPKGNIGVNSQLRCFHRCRFLIR